MICATVPGVKLDEYPPAGCFDTVPSRPNAPGCAGSWSNYPYFASGVIVVTSIREGLFILNRSPAAFNTA